MDCGLDSAAPQVEGFVPFIAYESWGEVSDR